MCFRQIILATGKGWKPETGRPIRKGKDPRMDGEESPVETEKGQRGGRAKGGPECSVQ